MSRKRFPKIQIPGKICFQIPGTFAMFGRSATAAKVFVLADRNILGLGVYAENISPSTPEAQIFIGKKLFLGFPGVYVKVPDSLYPAFSLNQGRET